MDVRLLRLAREDSPGVSVLTACFNLLCVCDPSWPLRKLLLKLSLLVEHILIWLLKGIIFLVVVVFLEFPLTCASELVRRIVLPVDYLFAFLDWVLFLIGAFFDSWTTVRRIVDIWKVGSIDLVLLLIKV